MLFLCILIGLYFGFVKKRESSAEMDYLMGGRTMSVFPISLSLIARWTIMFKSKIGTWIIKSLSLYSFISGITLLGLPTEVYLHGIQYVYVALGVLSMGFVMSIFYLPVFYGLQITSSYEVSKMFFLFNFHDLECCTVQSNLTFVQLPLLDDCNFIISVLHSARHVINFNSLWDCTNSSLNEINQNFISSSKNIHFRFPNRCNFIHHKKQHATSPLSADISISFST